MLVSIIKQNKLWTYLIGSGIYGFARSFNGNYVPPHDVIGDRVVLALSNGVFYAIYAPYYQMKLLNRIDIKLKGKDASKYKGNYEDMFSNNMNVFI